MLTASMVRRAALAAMVALPALLVPRVADAFCGFYVAGGDAKLYNNATVVVMMRDGTRTVLSDFWSVVGSSIRTSTWWRVGSFL
jgi:hypothetical protein